MAGYTPLFSSLTTGTLYGRWPDIGLWAVVLSLPDKHGVVDVTPEYLAGVTGLPATDVVACMERFCAPDPRSRSGAEGGARLMLIDPARSWGWKIVNHGLYRERARKQSFDSQRVVDGRNAQRMADRKETREDPTPPAKTRADPPSDADADADANTNKDKKPDRRTARAADEPEGFSEFRQKYPKRAGGQRWGDALKFFKRRVAEGAQVSVILEGADRYATFARATGIERTERVQQAATFLGDNRGYLELWQPPPRPQSPVERIQARMRNGANDERVVSEQGGASLEQAGRLLR